MEQYSLVFLIVFVVLCYLETLLSNCKNKYLGLIIPALTFICSIAALIIFMQSSFDILKALFTLLFINIPTGIFLLIYHSKRKKLN